MKPALLLVPLLIAGAATAQLPRVNLPQGSPLGSTPIEITPDAAQIEAQRAQQARAVARARFARQQQAMEEAFAPAPTRQEDAPARTAVAPSYGQTIGPADDSRPRTTSPYGGYYQIRTPWDR